MRSRIPTGSTGFALTPDPEALISWPCYEPAAVRAIELTERDLLNHVFILGSTGAGKTTLLVSALRQLLCHDAGSRSEKVGLLIFDPKMEALTMVRALARAAKREKDVVVLGPDGDHFLACFGRLSLEGVERTARRVLAATEDMGPLNAYWNEARYAMIEAALTLLAVTKPNCSFDAAVTFMRSWFFNLRSESTAVTSIVDRARQFLDKLPNEAPQAIRRQVLNALDQVALWKELDARTRSNLQSCLMNALRATVGVAAGRCFEACGRPSFEPADIATKGKICVVSMNALTEPALAQLMFKLVRIDFFDAVQCRRGPDHRLCGMIADEYPLLALQEDVEQLATVRSKRCFVVAAAQGLAGLDERLGERARRAALLNFNTVIFQRTREEETAEMAYISLGIRKERRRGRRGGGRTNETTKLLQLTSGLADGGRWEPVCPPGTLGRLQPHQAFIVKADGSKTDFPLWFIPWFEIPDFPGSEASSPLLRPVRRRVAAVASPDLMHQIMIGHGLKPLWTHEVILAAANLCRPKESSSQVMKTARRFFREKGGVVPHGLGTLPLSWLAGLPHIISGLSRLHGGGHLPFAIEVVGFAQGALLLGFAEEHSRYGDQATLWNKVRLRVNRAIYPSLWRPIKRRHFLALWIGRPELRSALQSCCPEGQPWTDNSQGAI